MRKPSSYYFIVLALMNLLIAHCLYTFSGWILYWWDTYHRGEALPAISEIAFHHPQWPVVIAVLAVVGACVSFATKISSARLSHVVIGLLTIDTVVLFVTVFAYAAPFVRTTELMRP